MDLDYRKKQLQRQLKHECMWFIHGHMHAYNKMCPNCKTSIEQGIREFLEKYDTESIMTVSGLLTAYGRFRNQLNLEY